MHAWVAVRIKPAMRSSLAALVLAVALTFAFGGFVVAADAPAGGAAPATKAAKAKKPAKKAAKAPLKIESAKEILEGEDVRDFRSFCDIWMQKLRERDTYNVAHITWDTKDGEVVGEYVSYGTDRTCSAREEPGKDPIGKITYREIRYRRQGATPTAAMAGAGTIVEQTDVTEIFRYAKGRWQY